MNATNITKTLENIFESTRDDKRPLRGNKISNISFQATSTPSNSILEIPARNKLLTGKKNILRGFEERKPTHDVNTEPREQDYRNAPIVKILKSDNIVKSKMRKEQKRLKEKHKVDDDVILLDDISSDETTKKVVISHNPEEKTIKNLVVPQPRVKTANLKIFKSDHNALLKRPSSSHSANVRLKNSEINSEHYLSFKDPLDLLGEPKFHIFKRRIQNSGL